MKVPRVGAFNIEMGRYEDSRKLQEWLRYHWNRLTIFHPPRTQPQQYNCYYCVNSEIYKSTFRPKSNFQFCIVGKVHLQFNQKHI